MAIDTEAALAEMKEKQAMADTQQLTPEQETAAPDPFTDADRSEMQKGALAGLGIVQKLVGKPSDALDLPKKILPTVKEAAKQALPTRVGNLSDAWQTTKNIGGIAENAATMASSLYGAPASKIASLAGPNAEKAVADATVYQPKTEGGQSLAGMVNYPFEKYGELAGKVPDVVQKATGSPGLATAAGTVAEAAPYIGALLGLSKTPGMRGGPNIPIGDIAQAGKSTLGSEGGFVKVLTDKMKELQSPQDIKLLSDLIDDYHKSRPFIEENTKSTALWAGPEKGAPPRTSIGHANRAYNTVSFDQTLEQMQKEFPSMSKKELAFGLLDHEGGHIFNLSKQGEYFGKVLQTKLPPEVTTEVARYMAKERGMTTKEFMESRPEVLQDELVAAATELWAGKGFGASGQILGSWAEQNPKAWAPLKALHNKLIQTDWQLPKTQVMTPSLKAALKDKYGVDVRFFTKSDIGTNYLEDTSAPRTGTSGGMLKGRRIEEAPKADIPLEAPKTEPAPVQWMLNQRNKFDTTGEWMQKMTRVSRENAAEAWKLHQEQTGGGPMASKGAIPTESAFGVGDVKYNGVQDLSGIGEPNQHMFTDMKTHSTFMVPDTSPESITAGLNRIRERFKGSEPEVISKPTRAERTRLLMNDKGLSSYDARVEEAKLRAQGHDFSNLDDMENHLHGTEFESRMSPNMRGKGLPQWESVTPEKFREQYMRRNKLTEDIMNPETEQVIKTLYEGTRRVPEDVASMSLPKKESFSDTPLGERPPIDIKPAQALDNMKRIRDNAISKAHDMAEAGVPGTKADLAALGDKINAMNKRIAEIEKTEPTKFQTPELGPGRTQDLSGITRIDEGELAKRKAMVKEPLPKEEPYQEPYRRAQSIPDSRQISPIGKDRIDNRMPTPKPESGYTLTLNTKNWKGEFTVDNMGRIVNTPKQAKWSTGKEIGEVLDYYKNKGILQSTGEEGKQYVLQTKVGDRWETLTDKGNTIAAESEESAIRARNEAVKKGYYHPDKIRVWEVDTQSETKPQTWRGKEEVGKAPKEETARAVATTQTGIEALDKILGRKTAERKAATKSRAEQTLDKIFGRLPEDESRMSKPPKTGGSTVDKLDNLYRKTMEYAGDAGEGTIRSKIESDPYARVKMYKTIKDELDSMPMDTPAMRKLVGRAKALLRKVKDPKAPESATSIELAAEWMHEGLRRQIKPHEDMIKAEYGEADANRIIDKLWNKYDLEGTEVESKMTKPPGEVKGNLNEALTRAGTTNPFEGEAPIDQATFEKGYKEIGGNRPDLSAKDLHAKIAVISGKPGATNNAYALGATLTKEQAVELWTEYRNRSLASDARPTDDLVSYGREAFLDQTYREAVEGYLHKGNIKGHALEASEIDKRLGIGVGK